MLPSPSSPSGNEAPMSPQATPTSPSTVDHDWERLADATEIVEDGLREVYVSACSANINEWKLRSEIGLIP